MNYAARLPYSIYSSLVTQSRRSLTQVLQNGAIRSRAVLAAQDHPAAWTAGNQHKSSRAIELNPVLFQCLSPS
jgi:hypothetical protein